MILFYDKCIIWKFLVRNVVLDFIIYCYSENDEIVVILVDYDGKLVFSNVVIVKYSNNIWF